MIREWIVMEKKALIDEIIRALKDELEFDDDCGYTQWVMAVGLKETSKGTYLARTVIKTNQSPYVDGTDITVRIIEDGNIEIDQAYIGEAPILHGSEIDSSIKWIEEVNLFCYIQPEDPFGNENNMDGINNQR